MHLRYSCQAGGLAPARLILRAAARIGYRQRRFQRVEPRGEIGAAEADAEAIGGGARQLRAIDARRQQQHAMLLDQPGAKGLDPVGAGVARKAHDAAIGPVPAEELGMRVEEIMQQRDIVGGNAAVARQDALTRLERDRRQHL